jgi:peptide/nickel transport system permease protein
MTEQATEHRPGTPRRVRRARPRPDAWAWTGIIIVFICAAASVVGPMLAPYGVGKIVAGAYDAPGPDLILGSDALGRDVLSRLIHGARLTVGIAFASTTLGFLMGMGVGFTAAELKGRFDDVVTWAVDALLSFPPILFALIVIAGLSSDVWVLVMTIAIIQSSRVARVSRALGMNIAHLEFVEVARARGESLLSVLVREIWPSTVRPLGVEFGLRFTFSILFVSSLSFLGLGIQPPEADWGSLVRENMTALSIGNTWAILAPALAIGALAVGVNLIVDWLGSQSGRAISEELTT